MDIESDYTQEMEYEQKIFLKKWMRFFNPNTTDGNLQIYIVDKIIQNKAMEQSRLFKDQSESILQKLNENQQNQILDKLKEQRILQDAKKQIKGGKDLFFWGLSETIFHDLQQILKSLEDKEQKGQQNPVMTCTKCNKEYDYDKYYLLGDQITCFSKCQSQIVEKKNDFKQHQKVAQSVLLELQMNFKQMEPPSEYLAKTACIEHNENSNDQNIQTKPTEDVSNNQPDNQSEELRTLKDELSKYDVPMLKSENKGKRNYQDYQLLLRLEELQQNREQKEQNIEKQAIQIFLN